MSVQFKSEGAKEIWVLSNILRDLQYIGKETKLSETEKGLKKEAMKDIKKILKKKIKQEYNKTFKDYFVYFRALEKKIQTKC